MVFPADEWPEGAGGTAGTAGRSEAPTAVLGSPGGGRLGPVVPGPEAAGPTWSGEQWQRAYQRVRLTGRAYVWLNLVEQRLRSLLDDLLRPVYAPAHGADWVTAAAGPVGEEWVSRAAAVREVSRRKGFLLDPADDDPLVFLTLPQLRELMVQHWPCFEPYLDDRREIELALDELEVARHVVSRNRSLSPTVLAQAERAAARVLGLLDGRPAAGAGLPADVIEELVAGRYADVTAVHADRILLQRDLPMEDLLEGARRLDALGIALGMLCQNYTGKRLARLAAEGCRTRLLFLNPASSAVRRRERELGLGRGELSRSIEMNIMHVRRVRARLRDPGAFEIRVFDETPRFTAYLVEGTRLPGSRRRTGDVGVVQPYLRRARGIESPALVLRPGAGPGEGEDPGLLAVYREEFEGVWTDSRSVS
ncbi:SAV2148 family HEPN domain-containing protein [Kitasatospora sp. NBC_01287]|uniref:SAV2148 family HEPN domain-containing protein n=1 Tax=Kitasatospora sp. NBC_01287 TaxID=2903573 RepID=UPI00224EA6C8|nr:SAV2148 family HEPN domain-containing protein [Kitasatospora sp. NBC_01287]MCX4749720.1 SAV2148 family HEPN domain-containing protein [Kitasatospora sp. NBC_01287]